MDDASLDDFFDTGAEGDDGEDEAAAPVSDSESDASDRADQGREAGDPAERDGDASETDGAGEAASERPDAEDADDGVAVDPDGVAGATTTYAWAPGGAVCAECGETVQRRWDEDGRLVCPGCKEW